MSRQYNLFDLVVVPFPFTDKTAVKQACISSVLPFVVQCANWTQRYGDGNNCNALILAFGCVYSGFSLYRTSRAFYCADEAVYARPFVNH